MAGEVAKLFNTIIKTANQEKEEELERDKIAFVFVLVIGLLFVVCLVGTCFGILKCCIECSRKPKTVVMLNNDRLPTSNATSNYPVKYQYIDNLNNKV